MRKLYDEWVDELENDEYEKRVPRKPNVIETLVLWFMILIAICLVFGIIIQIRSV